MKSKITIIRMLAAHTFLLCLALYSFAPSLRADVPGNIVQNGTLQANFADWSGNIIGILDNWPTVPNNYAALANDIYQNLPTTPGQQYAISFYAAADLYFGPSVTVQLSLNNQVSTSYVTPPYTYNPGINRYEQMQWEQFTSSFVASSSTTRLEFIDVNTYDFGLAGVSLVPVPEPSSTTFLLLTGAVLVLTGCWKWQRSSLINPLQGASR